MPVSKRFKREAKREVCRLREQRSMEGNISDAQIAYRETIGLIGEALNSYDKAMGALSRVGLEVKKRDL